MSASIPLAKGLNIPKLEFPVFLSEKLDGVPVRIDLCPNGRGAVSIGTQSRSGKPLPSVDTLVNEFVQGLYDKGMEINTPLTFVAEITHEFLVSFKDVGGVVRKKTPQENLILNFFDFQRFSFPDEPFFIRTQQLCNILNGLDTGKFRYVQQVKVGAERIIEELAQKQPPVGVEGYIARSHNATWKPNSRHWDYQKIVVDPTLDLRIVGVEEATSEAGQPLGMVGRLIAEYHDENIGIGPGKLTHDERRALWNGSTPYAGMIACIKYKRDDSYDALRQPTFQHWRPEKTEPSYE